MSLPSRILLVDDDPDARALVVQRLVWELPGVGVEEAGDAARFSAALEAGGFDVVITEAALPWLDGLGVVRAVRARWPRCPVVMLAGSGNEELAIAAVRAGAADYLPKSARHLARLGPAVIAAAQQQSGQRALVAGESLSAAPAAHEFAESDPSPIIRIDSTGTVTYANAASAPLLTEWGSGVGRPAPALWRSLVVDVLDRGARRTVEAPYGDRLYAFTLLPVPRGNEAVVFAADVTPRKKLEDALQECQDALAGARRAGQDWAAAFDASGDPIALLDVEGRIVKANRALAELLRRPADELVGGFAGPVLDGAAAPAPDAALIRCLRDREAATEEWAPPGAARQLLRTYAPILDARGAVSGAVLTAKAVPARPRSDPPAAGGEKTGLSRLASGLAHELNNPLTALMGHAQFLLLAQTDAKVNQRAEVIVQEAERMAKIIANLVAFARPRRLDRRPLQLNTAIEQAVAARQAGLVARKIGVKLDLDRSLPLVLADAGLLQQVFVHLLTNAEEALARAGSGGEIRVASGVSAAGEMVQVVVDDTGPGIPAAVLPKVFDPFVTTRGTGEGAGLGLSLCAAILAEHGGAIRAGNRPEGGARLELELPPAAATGGERAGGGAPAPRRPRVLVVDDQQAVAEFVAGALGLDDYEVEVALGGPAAARRLRDAEYDAVLTDFNMPGVGGDELYEETRRAAHPPAVGVMTANSLDEESTAFLARTGLPTLHKPFTIEKVRAFVRSLLTAAR